MKVLGMISGTSHDGIDVAVVDFQVSAGVLEARVEHAATIAYDDDLRARLLGAMPPAPVGFDVVCELDTRIGQAFAEAASAAIAATPGSSPVDAICSHGQTVFHWVDGGHVHGTLQIGQPAWIAAATGLPVIADLRVADIAAGGQGAPLVPVLDRLLLGDLVADGHRVGALNLGGIANVTLCRAESDSLAWDIGPANALIDAVVTASDTTAETFDRDGRLADKGVVDDVLLATLLEEPYYRLPAPKSTGKELFDHGYGQEALERSERSPSLPDLVATLTELTARTVANAIQAAEISVLVASGGGVRNRVLMSRLSDLLPSVRMLTTDDLGVASDEKEAVAFALIGWATLHGLPGSVPSCTGAAESRVLGSVTPAPGRALPRAEQLQEWPTSLVFVAQDRL